MANPFDFLEGFHKLIKNCLLASSGLSLSLSAATPLVNDSQ